MTTSRRDWLPMLEGIPDPFQLPDTEAGDRAFHAFYLSVCQEHSRRLQRKANDKVFGRKG